VDCNQMETERAVVTDRLSLIAANKGWSLSNDVRL